jgi:hypothetical protein
MSKVIKAKCKCSICGKPNRVYNKTDICFECNAKGDPGGVLYRRLFYGIGSGGTGSYMLDQMLGVNRNG